MSKYDMPMVDAIDTIPGKIMSRIRQGSNVLEFGCANGRMTKYMRECLQCKVFIVEIDREAFNVAVQYAEDGFCGNIEAFEWVNKAAQNKFDYIIFADVLEHLKEPEKVIVQAANLLKEDGEIVISIPNIAHFDVLANLYLNHFKYTKIGLLDDTHIHFWGKEDLCGFFAERSLSVTVIDGVYVNPYCTEQAVAKDSLPSDVEEALLKKENSDLYQFFIVLQKEEWAKKKNVTMENKLKNSWLLSESTAHLYWDFGEGYHTRDCVSVSPDTVTNGTCFVYRFDKIPNGCRKIRFDLPMGASSTVGDFSALTDKGALEFRALNGVLLQNVFVFADANPQIEIDIPADIERIEIKADVRIKRDAQSAYFYSLLQNVPKWRSACERLGSVESELANKNGLLEDVSSSLDEARSALMQATSDLRNTKDILFNTKGELSCAKADLEKANAKAKLIQEEMKAKEKDINGIRLELDKKTEELNVALQDAEDAKAQIDYILNEKNEQERVLNDTIQQAATRTAELEEQIRQLTNELQKSIDYGHHMENIYHRLSEQHNVVVTSQSWRITYPMRRFLDLLKRCRFFMLIWKTMRSLKFNGFRKTCKKIFNYIFRRNKDRTPELIEELVIPKDLEKNPFAFFAHKAKKNALFSETYAIDTMREYDESTGKKILLVSHELDLTGAPVAIFHFARILKNVGYCPVVVSPHSGNLAKSFEEENIPTFVCPSIYEGDAIKQFSDLFDLVVASTIVSAPVVSVFNGTNMPVLWWIHEAEASYTELFEGRMPKILADNVFVKVGGKHAAKLLNKHRPLYEAEQLLYYVPDFTAAKKTNKIKKKEKDLEKNKDAFLLPAASEGKKVFCLVAMMEYRKGQDIAVDAILKLSKEDIAKSYFVFVGKPYYKEAYMKIQALCEKYPDNVLYIEELSMENIRKLYGQMDCLMCPSRDDPMPIVVTEALMLSKDVICSENTGSAALIERENAGIVYTDNSVEQLAQCISRVINDDGIEELRANARSIYDKYFSEKVFSNNVISLMNHIFSIYSGESQGLPKLIEPMNNMVEVDGELAFDGTVSIVIPAYNAGDQFEDLLQKIIRQKKVRSIETVVVDSGSTDRTVEYCEKYDVNLIKIPNKEFSHSYARNLGAKNARGEVLLFMTQDASPLDEYWVYEMIKPIISGEAAAVSCQEYSGKDIDLYYRCASENHAKFQGVFYEDKLNVFDSKDDSITLRQKASLNDVASAIRADVFSRYLYRFGYAEDLDMGIRLLKDGYAVKLTKATSVVHGHNRAAGYYMKRGLVEVIAMEKIMEDSKQPIESDFSIARKIVYGSKMMTYLEKLNRAEIKKECSTENFFSAISNNIQRMYAQSSAVIEQEEPLSSQDSLLRWCVDKVAPWAQASVPDERELVQHVTHYAEHIVKPFVEKENPVSVDLETQNAVYSCLEKQFCLMVGALFARADKNSELYQSIISLAEGV